VGLLDLFGKKDVSKDLTKKMPYSIKVTFTPYRLKATKNDSVNMNIDLSNHTKEPLLTSIVVELPKKLSLDSTGLSQTREIRLGELPPKQEKTIRIPIFSTHRTDAGSYNIGITAIAHYRNYAYVLNSEKKKTSLRAV